MNDYQKRRFWDASLSKLDLPEQEMLKLHTWLKKPKNNLIYIGNGGLGKTYFCHAIMNDHKDLRIHYRKDTDFFRDIRKEVGSPGGDYIYKTRTMATYDCDFWILDDIGSSQMTEWQKEVLFTFIDERYENMEPTIITSNIWLADMSTHFTPRIKSRLAAKENTIIELNWDDKRELGL
jgi:DNA replication protein DnaC